MNLNFKLHISLLLFFGVFNNACFASDTTITFTKEIVFFGDHVSVYKDVTGNLSIKEVQNKPFIKSSSPVPNFGISNATYWVKFTIKNTTINHHLILSLSLPTLDNVTFYYTQKNGKYGEVNAGESYPFYTRKYHDSNYLFDLYINRNDIRTYFLKVSSREAIQLPLRLGSKTDIFNHLESKTIMSGIYFGIMLVMILYNLFLYFLVKDKSYIYYVVYIFLILLTQTSLQGYPFQFLWPNSPKIAQLSLFIFPSLVGLASIAFMNVFLRIREHSKLLYKLSFLFSIPYVISVMLAFLSFYKSSFLLMEANAMLVSFFMFYTILKMVKNGNQSAKYFLLAWTVFLVGVIIYILKDFEILPFNNFTRYTMQTGSAIETILLSFALASRINFYKKEKEQSQKESLKLLQDNQNILENQKELLEEQVTARTFDLELTLDQLKQTQSQLVETEKMSSLGQLTAGIAHEINNPINFVSSNIPPLKQDLDDLNTIIDKYEELKNTEDLEAKWIEIEKLKIELEFDYLKEELKTIIKGIEDGAQRTTEIVSGLRNFSRLDEEELKLVNINEGIESTITLIRHKLNGVNLQTFLDDVPLCFCNAGKLNQLIMNLIDNAIYAVQEKHEDNQKGLIIVSTKNDKKTIYISVKDNGIGIPKKVQDKLFEPFFTTKEVGQGTGLGLSIVKGIVDSHNGEISIEPNGDSGTKILVKIPIIQK